VLPSSQRQAIVCQGTTDARDRAWLRRLNIEIAERMQSAFPKSLHGAPKHAIWERLFHHELPLFYADQSIMSS
jgi:hypothetical protein